MGINLNPNLKAGESGLSLKSPFSASTNRGSVTSELRSNPRAFHCFKL